MNQNYIPLYRKYRPQTLETLVGQEHIKKTLTSAIELGKVSHAYLFTGPRGTGKTSTARILAKSLNCKNGPTIHPCGECESCRDITNSIPIDVIEIDAASNRKVEDAQNLLEKIQYAPVNGKYKIYIIDEVHMLSNTAFNALLKTLEEPPENVIFILATTEVHKVLDTIKSRCQRFDFKRITTDDIVKHLRYISDQEKINITDDALLSIAKNSAGGMRDSISLLDQLSILGVTKQITIDDVNNILGRISFEVLKELTDCIINSDSPKALEILDKIYNTGNEPLQIFVNLSEYLKNLLITKTCAMEILPQLTGLNELQIKELTKQKDLLETQQIVFLIERTSYYIKEIKLSTNQHLCLEVGIIDLSNMTENSTLLDLQNRISAIENKNTAHSQSAVNMPIAEIKTTQIKEHEKVQDTVIQKENTEEKTEAKADDFTPPPIAKKFENNDVTSAWSLLLSNISSPSTRALLNQLGSPAKINSDEIVIVFKNDRAATQINDSKKQMIFEAAKKIFNKDVSIVIKVGAVENTNIKSSNNRVAETPKEIDKNRETPLGIKENIEKKIETDQEKMVLDLFDGKYVE